MKRLKCGDVQLFHNFLGEGFFLWGLLRRRLRYAVQKYHILTGETTFADFCRICVLTLAMAELIWIMQLVNLLRWKRLSNEEFD